MRRPIVTVGCAPTAFGGAQIIERLAGTRIVPGEGVDAEISVMGRGDVFGCRINQRLHHSVDHRRQRSAVEPHGSIVRRAQKFTIGNDHMQRTKAAVVGRFVGCGDILESDARRRHRTALATRVDRAVDLFCNA